MSKFCTSCNFSAVNICYNDDIQMKGGDTMRIAVVEDLDNDFNVIEKFITEWAGEHQIPLVPAPMRFTCGEEFLASFSAGKFDLIFLDIYMADMNDMETARWIRKSDASCQVIFTTTSTDFAVQSYEVGASGYLVKPYTKDRFIQTMNRCRVESLEHTQSIMVPGAGGKVRLFLHQITYTEYQRRYALVHLQNGDSIKIMMRDADFSDLLLEYPYFCSCIRGILVNFEFVASLSGSSFRLTDGTSVPISRSKYEEVKEQFFSFSFARTRGGL